MQDFDLLNVKKYMPMQIVESVRLKLSTMHLHLKVLFPSQKNFIRNFPCASRLAQHYQN